jgi:hypothetical protein
MAAATSSVIPVQTGQSFSPASGRSDFDGALQFDSALQGVSPVQQIALETEETVTLQGFVTSQRAVGGIRSNDEIFATAGAGSGLQQGDVVNVHNPITGAGWARVRIIYVNPNQGAVITVSERLGDKLGGHFSRTYNGLTGQGDLHVTVKERSTRAPAPAPDVNTSSPSPSQGGGSAPIGRGPYGQNPGSAPLRPANTDLTPPGSSSPQPLPPSITGF